MIASLILDLEVYSKERRKIRRRLCKYLRDHQREVVDGWVKRKISNKYLGDLTDRSLIHHVKKVMRRINTNEI